MELRQTAGSDWRGHLGGKIAALSLVLLTGAAAAVWRGSRRAEGDIDARTRARLLTSNRRSADHAVADKVEAS